MGLKLLLPHYKKERKMRVFEIRVLRRIFGSKRGNGGMERIAHDLYFSPDTVGVIK
jgi:hypothetical protein